jgi:hypothetical protein
VCEKVLLGSLRYTTPTFENERRWKGDISYAGSYRHRLV